MAWDSTTIVLVHAAAGGQEGVGCTCAVAPVAGLVAKLAGVAEGRDTMDRQRCSAGHAGSAATAISALDAALWDLKAKLLDLPLAVLLGRHREGVPIYGGGGFITYDDRRLADQFAGWVERDGCRAVKMRIGTDPARDPARIRAAKAAIGGAELFVDANGAYGVKQALHLARVFAAEADVRWFEEPVSSDHLVGLRRT